MLFALTYAAKVLCKGNIQRQRNASVAGYEDSAFIPLDVLQAANESLEFKCLLEHYTSSSGSAESNDGCPVSFDSILCWPKTAPGTWAVLPCLEEFKGVHYDISQNATRFCHSDSKWDNYTSYEQCRHLTDGSGHSVSEFAPGVELPTIIYYTGYTISLISLTMAVAVFIHFKDLRCLRNTIHANLFFAYIMSALLWILTLSLQMTTKPTLAGCIVLVTLFHYFSLTNFFWMLVEGLYLYMLVVETFSGDNLRFNLYASIGWGGPAIFVGVWSIAKGVTLPGNASNFDGLEIDCAWMRETPIDWIFQGPACAVLIINLIFLVRIMWVLITKLRSANTVETRQYRKASKALLVLIPLLGITYLVVMSGPNEGVGSYIFAIARAVLLSTQGFSVSLFYCFLNSEVRLALRHRIDLWRDERNIRIDQLRQRSRRYQSGINQSKDYSPRSRTESIRPLTSYGKRESCASSATTTTLLGLPTYYHRGSNGALHMYAMPRAISPLMQIDTPSASNWRLLLQSNFYRPDFLDYSTDFSTSPIMQATVIPAAVMEDNNTVVNTQATYETQPYSYDTLFPALPESSTPVMNNVTTNMRVGTSVVTQVFRVPMEERKLDSEKFGEGESLRTCQNIMKDTGAHIEISSGKDQSITFLITGKNNEVIDARRKILIHFQTQANKHIFIPKEHHRCILGKKGERLREIEKLTSTKINVPNIGEDSNTITISGTKENVEKAEHEIKTMSDEQSKKAFERVTVPKIYHPFVLGPFNENLNKMIEETGARINVPPQSVMSDEIVITGEKDGVYAAKAKIEAIHKDAIKKCTTVSVEVPKAQHKYVIGQRGSTIQDILQLTGVSVEMPPADSKNDTITLRGPQDKLGTALSTVYVKANSVKTTVVDAPTWVHKYIIGRKGAKIREFNAEFPSVHVDFSENKIKIEGDPEQVEKSSEQYEAIVKEYINSYTSVDMVVNPKHCKHIIGKAGSNVNRLKEELGVFINIEEEDGNNRIRIEGPTDGVQKAYEELQEQIGKLDNEKEKDVIIDHRLFRSIIGSKGENIREIRDKYNQVQIMFPGQNEKSDKVKLRGPKDDVDKCHKHLMKIVKDLQESSFVQDVPIFKQFHKFIIGKGGVNIKKIRDETQTKIDLPAEGDRNEVIVITGKKENVLEARDRIQKIQNELADIITEEITIPPKYYNSIIGAGGKLISSIMEDCGGVAIKFPSLESKSDVVTIRGPKEDVEKAKAQLLELSNERQLSSFSSEIRAKVEHHKFLIGKNGASIKKIKDKTGVRIFFPDGNDEDKELVTIIGKKENVEAAKAELEIIIKGIDNITEGEIAVDQKHHKYFVAKRGEVLHRITEECGGVNISFPRPGIDSDRVTIKGAKDCIEAAKQRIMEIVSDLESQVTIECIIPQRHHRTVMGSRGVKVQGVTSDFDVQIKFPDRLAVDTSASEFNGDEVVPEVINEDQVRQGDIIRITGKKEKCEAAKQALLDLVPIVKEISVPFDLHRSIIGQKGHGVRELMNRYDVHIELSPPDQKLDLIKITGTPSNVENAELAINERVDELELDRKDRELRSFELKIEVDPEYHPKIIGRKGAVINQIRATHDVQISFPKKDDDEDNIITIQGYEKAATAARDDILKIVYDLDKLVKEVLTIDSRIHPRLIGQRGRSIRKIMEDYKVEIKFPKPGDKDPNIVTIIGSENDVSECKDHLLNLEEEYMQDTTSSLPSHTNAFSDVLAEAFNKKPQNTNTEGFVVQGAPWQKKAPNTQSQEDFPAFMNAAPVVPDQLSSAWGSRR